jgi:hypothetical protein
MKRSFALLLIGCLVAPLLAAPPSVSDFIRVDQFGYLPEGTKVAVVADPQVGYDAALSFDPSTGPDQYQVRRWDNDEAVFTGTLRAWNGGATDASSGDRAWWLDFSALRTPGSYYVYDVGRRVGSGRFEVAENVYANVLRAAVRVFYYNRCNHDKKLEHAGANWADGASFLGPGQDREARSVTDRGNAATARDLSGGWWDAGDYNKYVTFAREAMHHLLDAYEQNPTIWGDNHSIPESGNGVPDLLDELKWELDWLRKMQNPDGSALVKMGLLRGSDGQASLPPSTDQRPRYYYPGSCSSGTIALASMLAHAAVVFKNVPALASYGADLQARAVRAFDHYQANPKIANCDDGTIQAGDADVEVKQQEKMAVEAAVFLYAATREARFQQFVEEQYTRINDELSWWGPYATPLTEALLYYAQLPGASARLVEAVNSSKVRATNQDFYKWNERDPYRAYMRNEAYHWGSLNARATTGFINWDLVQFNLDATNHAVYRQRAEEILHYFHGVNPFNLVYMSNMAAYGAEKSVDELFHSWFADKSDWDNVKSKKGGPAPGYVPGGPNKQYKPGDGSPCTMTPPCNQPHQKSYRNWNGVWPDASWEVTEPAIYYQAAYVKLLSKFVKGPATGPEPILSVVTGVEDDRPAPSDGALRVWPNPTEGRVQVNLPLGTSSAAQLTLFNAHGQVCGQQTLPPAILTTELDTAHLPAGLYLLRYQSAAGQQLARRLVVRR